MRSIESIAGHFIPTKHINAINECNIGHINGTYFVDVDGDRYVLQRINKNVFKHPEQVMANIIAVTDHIHEKQRNGAFGTTLSFLNADGRYFFIDDEGEYWRCYAFVDGKCNQFCESAEVMLEAGRTFGSFQQLLADFDASVLYETIPDFHNTEKRYEAFEQAVMDDRVGRAASVADEIEFVRSRKDICGFITAGIKSGRFPLRVTHNDTKLNNVITDRKTGRGICVLDLDTVMPGSLLFDFGDAIRFGASSAAEDETDLTKVYVKTEMFEAFAKGFAEGIGTDISKEELDAFPDAAKILTFETGMRFLTDYLDGDRYFRTAHPQHNLDRARNQFCLVRDMENKYEELQNVIKRL